MNQKLKDTMHETADREFAAPDLDAIFRDGDRTVRRRRVVAGVGGLALASVLGVGGVALLGGDDDPSDFTDTTPVEQVPAWTTGSTLHNGDETYDLGVKAQALVRTSEGLVFLGVDSGVYRWTGEDAERIGEIGSGEMPYLIGDSDSPYIGWTTGSVDQPDFVVYDLATGEEKRFPATPLTGKDMDGTEPFFLALDGSTAYLIDGRGTVRLDVETGNAEVMAGIDDAYAVMSVENGVMIRWAESEKDDLGTEVVDPSGAVLLGYDDTESLSVLSPDGRRAASMGSASVWDVHTGEQIRLEAVEEGVGYEWLDNDTLMVASEQGGQGDRLELLRCTIPDGDCQPVGEVTVTEDAFALPSGNSLLLGLARGEVSEGASTGPVEEASQPPAPVSEAPSAGEASVPPTSATERP